MRKEERKAPSLAPPPPTLPLPPPSFIAKRASPTKFPNSATAPGGEPQTHRQSGSRDRRWNVERENARRSPSRPLLLLLFLFSDLDLDLDLSRFAFIPKSKMTVMVWVNQQLQQEIFHKVICNKYKK